MEHGHGVGDQFQRVTRPELEAAETLVEKQAEQVQKHQKPRKQHLRLATAARGGLHEPRRRHPQRGVAEEHGKAEFIERPRAVLHGERQAEEERLHIAGHVGKRELPRLHAGEFGQVVVAKLEDVAKARVVVGGVAGGHAQPRRQPRPQPRALFLF